MNEPSFEEAIEELRSIVQTLEKGDQPLESALSLFEKGIGLIKLCSGKLDQVEKRVEQLTKDWNGELSTRPFEKSQ